MLIVPYVCAEFRDRSGNVIHRITSEMRGIMQEAPDAIRQDLLFGMLVEDGSIRTPESETRKKALEQDPMVGVSADGKSEQPEKAGKAKAESKPATPEQKK